MRKDIINKLLEIEWDMFDSVSNIGGKASCQRNQDAFRIMRSSQFASWSDDVLASYLDDLTSAKKQGRNLMSEKYARMMEKTSPLEYSKIADLLPAVSEKKLELINKIIKNLLEWQLEISGKYPFIIAGGGSIYASSNNNKDKTSMETYLKGELSTYSFNTLSLYYKDIMYNKLNNINPAEKTLLYMVKSYGWGSLEEANDKLKKALE